MFDKRLKKTVFTLAVDDYPACITDITFPLMQRYAERIGAEFVVIRDRKFPGWPAAYEKLQIYRLASEMANDWNIFFDADAMIHPELPDLTMHIPMNTVAHNASDPAGVRWKFDRFFQRDGRNIGSCNWLAIASYQCIELWQPLEISLEEALANITPTLKERASGVDARHLIDDYTLSRNIAKYGLKFTTVNHVLRSLDLGNFCFFVHVYGCTLEEKMKTLQATQEAWKLKT